MNKDFSTLFIEINDSQFIFYVSKIDEKNDFKILSELKIPLEGIDNYRFSDFGKVSDILKKNIYSIEKKLDFTFKEVVLILDNFKPTFVNLSGFKILNGSQVLKENITYILNTLKSYVDTTELDKIVVHIFNSKFYLDNKKIENLPIGLFGDFYSHELSFSLINKNDYKNLKNVFENCNLKIRKLLLKSFIKGAFISNNNKNIETFFQASIGKHKCKILFFENNSLKYEQEFKFGQNIIIQDIAKITSLKMNNVEKILNNTRFNNEILEEELINSELLNNEFNKRIKKKLIQDISIARIKEIFEIMIFKNINLSYYYDNTKTIFIEIENELKESGLRDLFKITFSEEKDLNISIIDNLSTTGIVKTANKLVHFGWNKEAIPISEPKKSIIARLFNAIFE